MQASFLELQNGLDYDDFTSVDLVNAYFARIEEVNLQGLALRAVIETNPAALAQAAELDWEPQVYGKRGPLHGIPIIIKDNIATTAEEGMNTTAGSYALLGSIVPGDSTVAEKLRRAGAIILGKANLVNHCLRLQSEWAHFRGNLASGWSGRGGQCTNPYYPNADPCGSSSGSGVSSAIGLAAGALGSETDGSIVCPSNQNNLVGIKPSVGLVSRSGVIPISEHQDTVGPMCRWVTNSAALLTAIAKRDVRDNYTLAAPALVPDYTTALNANALQGARIGVPRIVFDQDNYTGNDPYVNVVFNQAIETLKSLGATIVDPADLPDAIEITQSNNETVVLNTDFKIDLNRYLANLVEVPTGVRTLADVIAYNLANLELELPTNYSDQSEFIAAEATTGFNSSYYTALYDDYALGRTNGIDAALQMYKLDALIMPSPGTNR
ncbi:amidase signature enzyme [Dacryopinax primogenitus]|uniref:Amidase signature enzyme n=1 Tax=Dacryopinax primogenitus (strain DJM 731) TaxID=1858805 RepID=M5GAG1_DACPD|nr:amidase signature enzyme [Dacryopinax primogenitus]EJU00898.1 amidase signature enzyme [Dacryopinax primogenitus]